MNSSFGQDKVYRTGSDEAGNSWDWKHRGGGDKLRLPRASPNVEGDLIQAMLDQSAHLRVEVENGLLRSRHSLHGHRIHHGSIFGLPDKLQKNIRLQYYDAGHMMYFTRRGSRQAQGQHRSLLSMGLPSRKREGHRQERALLSVLPAHWYSNRQEN